jgi:hypothetical protein
MEGLGLRAGCLRIGLMYQEVIHGGEAYVHFFFILLAPFYYADLVGSGHLHDVPVFAMADGDEARNVLRARNLGRCNDQTSASGLDRSVFREELLRDGAQLTCCGLTLLRAFRNELAASDDLGEPLACGMEI